MLLVTSFHTLLLLHIPVVENVTVDGGSTTSQVLTNLEEDTLYTITVQSIDSYNRMSANSNEVSVRTYSDGK